MVAEKYLCKFLFQLLYYRNCPNKVYGLKLLRFMFFYKSLFLLHYTRVMYIDSKITLIIRLINYLLLVLHFSILSIHV